ncbi:hypothetical protein B0A49_09942 [Cryomyces minteri]|uniref:J domain-containing protein n=1 Tax=Cryomyces minteri TaxID=331657 RepID=A0A4U0XBR2_9PEZI|nr:hypothetical protein B0A49_09942 [Cryomyces minteri]
MGANQSTNGTAGSASKASSAEVKISYYELLGIERQATDDGVKKAYRRKALELHPDRNYGNVEEATKLFAEVQAAYEVLSDPQERAWYDSHETAILRGDDADQDVPYEHNIRVTTADEITRIVRKFNSGVDFTDSPNGFFGFLRDMFATLAREEEAAADCEGLGVVDYPSFGHKADNYDDVVKPFYTVWSGFATKKTFSWKDVYRYSEAPDRAIRRLMEKENKRLRDEGVREFNDAVRSLVAFVRKRDPRYIPNTQSEAERQKALRDAAAAQKARSRAANEAKLKEHIVPEWTKAREPEELEESEEDEIEEDHYECVACRKTFKSENQWDAHEKSKKHQKAVQALKRKMRKDNLDFHLDEELSSSGMATPGSVENLEAENLGTESCQQQHVDGEFLESIDDLTLDHTDAPSMNEDKRHKPPVTLADPFVVSHGNEFDDESDDEYASRSEVQTRLGTDYGDSQATSAAEDAKSHAESTPRLGKAAQKRAKRAAQQAKADQQENKFKCATCNALFPSKTRLFQHINDHGHAAPVQQSSKGSSSKKKGKR